MYRTRVATFLLFFALAGCGGGDPWSRLKGGGADDGGGGPPSGVNTQLLEEESFASGPLNTAKWTLFSGTRGRTDFFNLLVFSEGKAAVNFDSYNQDNFFSRMSGSGLESVGSYALSTGLIVQARVRLAADAAGVVAEIGLRGDNGTTYDSISAAYLGNQPVSVLLAQVWQNESKTAPDYAAAARVSALKSKAGFSRRNWHTIELRYLGATAEWYLDGALLHQSAVPFAAVSMKSWLRIWAPETGWTQGYSATLSPAVNPYAAVRYPFDVDWVRIYRIVP